MEENKQAIAQYKMDNEQVYLIAIALFWFAQYIYIPLQVNFLSRQGVSSTLIGLVVSVYGLTQMLIRFPLGIYADRKANNHQLVFLGALLSGIASLFRVIFPTFWGFFIGNALSGVASAIWISFMIYFNQEAPKELLSNRTGKLMLYMNLGILTAFLISFLFMDLIGMQIICLLSVLAGVLSAFMLRNLPKKSNQNDIKTLKYYVNIIKNKKLWFFSIIVLIQQGIQMTTAMSFTNQRIEDLGANNRIIGISSIIYMISSVAFSYFATHFKGRSNQRKYTMALVFILLAIYLILVPRVDVISLILLLQIIPGAATGIIFSFGNAFSMDSIESNRKTSAMGLHQTIYAIGMTVFPMLGGTLLEKFNFSVMFGVLAVFSVIGAVMCIVKKE